MTGRLLIALALSLAMSGPIQAAVGVSAGAGLVNHPVIGAYSAPTGYEWRQGAGEWGEGLARERLRHRGYDEIHTPKVRGNQGLDLIVIRRGSAGTIQDVRFVEVKTHRGNRYARMGETARGKQMSRAWLAEKLRTLRTSSDPSQRALAAEVSRYRHSAGIAPEQLGEIHDINTRTGHYVVRHTGSSRARSRSQPIDQVLRQLQDRGKPPTREWAARHFATWDQIHSTDMRRWQASAAVSRSGRQVIRLIGPAGALVAFAIDVHELHGTWDAYAAGEISLEQLRRTQAHIGGGMAGALAGGMGGVYICGYIGILGGPFAWITVPVGAMACVGVASWLGYLGGSELGSVSAELWYRHVEDSTRDQLDQWILATPLSFYR